MSQKFEKLKTLLKELFQLDQPDLDFGFYRVMHARSAEVTQFLEKDLLPQVKAAFAQYQPADKVAIEKELMQVVAGVQAAGLNADDSPKVKELRAKLTDDAVDLEALEAEVYDHLYSFFRRYYSEGDFLSKRVYKPGVYAIPYEGEEVKLHWANADQYYIKTSEYLRDYAFRLRPDDKKNSMRVHFRLVDAAEGEHGNVKEAQGRERRFKLAPVPFVALEDGELVIRFIYQSDPDTQKELNAAAESAILGVTDASLVEWIKVLGAKHVRADGSASDATRLRVHLDRYTARNTFDYFIHKDLGGFLRRELDFYIKNEVMHLDDVENETAPRVEQYIAKIKVIRRLASKIITFLAQLEDFQKRLWLKKKFVVETSWCIRLGVIPEQFYPEIAANEAQREEWVRLCAVDELRAAAGGLLEPGMPGYDVPLTVEFLRAHSSLIVDTRHFHGDFVMRLVEAVGDLHTLTDGILFHSENFQALRLLEGARVESRLFVYADPPYNAASSEIPYKNTYKHASWMSLMADRLDLAFRIGGREVLGCIAIDENEQERLAFLLGDCLPNHAVTCVTVVHNPGGIQGDNFSYCHEFALFAYPGSGSWIGRMTRDSADIVPLRDWGGEESKRTAAANCFYPIYVEDGRIVGFGAVCDDTFHPPAAVIQRSDGRLEIYPIDMNGIERKWRFARQSVESIKDDLFCDQVNGEWVIRRRKSVYRFKTVWDDRRYNANAYGSKLLNNILGRALFSFPKSVYTVMDCIQAGTGNSRSSTTLDPFAGSGTSGHAVINLNRDDGGERKFILVEQADYFDTVLLPRLKKVTCAPEWTDGKPKRLASAEEAERSPRIMKVIRLESYEDTLNNLDIKRTDAQQSLLDAPGAQGPDRLKEQYTLRYLLNVETRGSQSLLNVAAFTDPTAYKLKVKRPGSDESREVNVDLIETFNWLIGLTVRHLAAPQSFSAEFARDGEGRLRLRGRLKQEADGPWWFRTVTGTAPDGRQTLVIWRKRPGGESVEGVEEDNLVLDEWFARQGYSAKDSEFDLIYVNGSNNLENLKAADDGWKVRLIEEDFFRLMFETDGI